MSQEIYEAFQELQGLEEATFSFDKPGMLGLQQFLNADDYADEDVTIVDVDAETELDKKDDYDGDAVLECCVCGGKITCDPKEVVIDQETQRANIEQTCPYCYNIGGFKVIGQIEAPEVETEETETEETESTVEAEEEPIAIDTENITVEEKEEPNLEEITEAKDDGDLWYKIYDKLEKLGKNSLYKRGGNKLDNKNQLAARIALFGDGSNLVVKAESEADLNRVKEILDKFIDKKVTYDVEEDNYGTKKIQQYKDKYGDDYKKLDLSKYYPYIVTVVIPEKEDLDESFDPEKSIKIREEDIINFDEETGDLETSMDYFPEDVKAGDKFIVKFVDQEDEYPVEFIFKFKEMTKYGTAALEWVDQYENLPAEEPEEEVEDTLEESFDGADIILSDEDIKSVDDNTAEIILTVEASKELKDSDYDGVVNIGFEEKEKVLPYEINKEEDEEGCIHMKFVGKKNELKESIENIKVETDSDVINVEPSEDGAVKIEAQPKETMDVEEATIAPVSDELKAEIEANSEPEAEEEPVEEVPSDEEEVEIDDFDEESFNDLGESYLKEVYDNVVDFKTTKGYINGDRIKLEGIIRFTSGKQAKTSFLFESKNISSRGKYKFIGENLQITNRKNAFILSGDIKEGKLLPESLTYNYNAKDANTGKLQRVYGTVKKQSK